MKLMIVDWVFPASFFSEIHSHKYELITYTLPFISPHNPSKTIHIYLKLIENLKLILRCLNSFSCISFSTYSGSGDISSDSIDFSPAKKRVRTVCKCGAVTCRGYLN